MQSASSMVLKFNPLYYFSLCVCEFHVNSSTINKMTVLALTCISGCVTTFLTVNNGWDPNHRVQALLITYLLGMPIFAVIHLLVSKLFNFLKEAYKVINWS